MEHYKSRTNDFFHFTNPHDDHSELEDHDYNEQQYDDVDDDDVDVDDDRSCDFNFHTFHPIRITQSQSQPPNFQTKDVVDQNVTLINSKEQIGTFDNGALIFEIDRTMKNLSDKLQSIIEGIDTRVSRLEDETCKLDKYVEDVKNSAESYHGTTHRKLRQMQHILQEVQDGVQILRDKHEIAETQLQLAKLQASKRDQKTSAQTNVMQQPHLSASPPFCHIPSTIFLNQLPSNEASFSPAISYRPPNPWPPEIPVLQYLTPPNQQSQIPHPPKADSQFPQSHQLNAHEGVVTPQNHPSMSHHSREAPYSPSYSHNSRVQHFPYQPIGLSSPQEFEVGLPQLTHVQSSRNYKSEFHAKYIPEVSSFTDLRPHGELLSTYESSNVKPVQFSQQPPAAGSRSHYTHLPVAQELPHALPTASDVEDESCFEENGNTIPADDIVAKVTAMGFRRDLVKASVRKLTENGSPLDLNVVLDRMMNNKRNDLI